MTRAAPWANCDTIKAKAFAYLDKHGEMPAPKLRQALGCAERTAQHYLHQWKRGYLPAQHRTEYIERDCEKCDHIDECHRREPLGIALLCETPDDTQLVLEERLR